MHMDPFSLFVVSLVVSSFLWAGYHIRQIRKNGIETEAVVTDIEERQVTDGDGFPMTYEDYHVRYRLNGRTVRATISNPVRGLAVGSVILIRYLPEKEDSVIYMGTIS